MTRLLYQLIAVLARLAVPPVAPSTSRSSSYATSSLCYWAFRVLAVHELLPVQTHSRHLRPTVMEFPDPEGAENALCLPRRCDPLGVGSCSHLAVNVSRTDRWRPAHRCATGQGCRPRTLDLLRRVLGTLRDGSVNATVPLGISAVASDQQQTHT